MELINTDDSVGGPLGLTNGYRAKKDKWSERRQVQFVTSPPDSGGVNWFRSGFGRHRRRWGGYGRFSGGTKKY